MPDRPKVITLQNLERFKEDYDQQVAAEYFSNSDASELSQRVTELENEVEIVASGAPAGVYETVSDLEADTSADKTRIYLITGGTSAGHWFYWNGSAWTDGGVYLSTGGAVPETREIAGIDLADDISAQELTDALVYADTSDINSIF